MFNNSANSEYLKFEVFMSRVQIYTYDFFVIKSFSVKPSSPMSFLKLLIYPANSLAELCDKRFKSLMRSGLDFSRFLIDGKSTNSAKLITSTALMAKMIHLLASF